MINPFWNVLSCVFLITLLGVGFGCGTTQKSAPHRRGLNPHSESRKCAVTHDTQNFRTMDRVNQ